MALKLEQEGRKFFLEAATRFESRLARQTFEFLAAEEDKHIERIEEFYASIRKTGSTKLPNLGGATVDERFESFQKRLARLKEEISPTASDAEAYRFALKFENGAEQLYEKNMAETRDPNIRAFYQWLINEEAMHSKVLESCLKFAEDPGRWFEQHGSTD